MKSKLSKVTLLILLLAFALTTLLLPLQAFAATSSSRPTSAEEVNYVENGDYVYNWGIRGEPAAFLSKYAQEFYTGNYTFDKLSKVGGGSTQSNAKDSALYEKLQKLMKDSHSYKTSYDATKNLYRYTDCENSNKSNISSFYSGKSLNSSWGNGWNREHTWPNSKGLNGQDENDIMMLRPTWEQENSSRGNTAYGQSSGYFNPDCENPPASLKGDVARICLYVYTRWGNTSYMWGSSGVMENLSVLLKWMEEDPVDTWEMGRNDAVQAITGTRNVFIDYPEYAWLLFGKDVPNTVYTPSQSNGVQAPDPDLSGSGTSGGNTGNDGNQGTTTPVETVHAGTKADPYTIADALAVGNSVSANGNNGKVVYVKGKVESFEPTTNNNGEEYFKNVVISDESTSSTFTLNTANASATADKQIKVGDTILAWGYIRINKTSGLPEMGTSNGTQVNFSIVTDTTGGDSTGGSTGGDSTGGSTGGDSTGGGSTGGDQTPNPNASATIDLTTPSNKVSASGDKLAFASGNLKVTIDKAESASDLVDYTDKGYGARVYKGATLTVEYPKITKLVLNCYPETDSRGDIYYDAFDELKISGATITREGAVVTITFATPIDKFVSPSVPKQLRVESIEVYASTDGGNQGGSTGGDSTGGSTGGDSTGGGSTGGDQTPNPDKGTKTNPYTIAEALAVGNSLSGSSSERVYIKGKVVSIGENKETYLKNVIISDSSTTETLRLFTINPNSPADLELKVGDTILVDGYIFVYQGEVEVGTHPVDKTQYANFSIVTASTDGGSTGGDSTGGSTGGDSTGGSTGGEVTPPVDDPTPDQAVESFKTAVADIAKATTINAQFDAIKTAVTAYNTLTSAQKQQVTTEIATLKTAISNYNTAISTQNSNANEALTIVLQTVVAVAVALAVAIITKKVLF